MMRRVTRSHTADAAQRTVHSVFTNDDLLEAILVTLPIRGIFIVQSVCRQFKDTIALSVKIQQKLFLRSLVKKETWDLCGPGKTDQSRHLHKTKLLPHHASKVDSRIGEPLTPAVLCPLLDQVHLDKPIPVLLRRLRVEEHDRAVFVLRNSRRSSGSWRGMHVTDPPCRKLSFKAALLDICRTPVKRAVMFPGLTLEEPNGVTLGRIVDAMFTTRSVQLVHYNRPADKRVRYCETVDRSIDELRAEYRGEDGDADFCEVVRLYIDLIDMVLPTGAEWAEFRENGILE